MSKIIVPAIPTQINVKDYGAVGDGTTDDTTAIQAAITAAEGNSGGVVYFPEGLYKVTSGFTITIPDIIIRGATRGRTTVTTIRLAPAADTVLFHFNYTYDYCSITDINLDTDGSNSTHSLTAIKLTDVSGSSIENVNIWRWWGADSVGINLLGRERVTIHKCQIVSNVPIYIQEDPLYATGIDHLHIHDCSLNAIGGATDTAPTTLTWASILAHGDARITGLYVNACALTQAQYGFYQDASLADYGANVSSGVEFHNCRTEQMQTSGWSVYFLGNTNAKLRNLTLANFAHTDDTAEGVYARYVQQLLLTGSCIQCDGSGDVMDLDDVDQTEWIGVYTDLSSTLTLSADTVLSWSAPNYTGASLPRSAIWQKTTGTTPETQKPIGLFSADKWAWAGEIADAGSIILPLGDNRDVEVGEARVTAMCTSGRPSGATSEISEYGHFLLSRSTDKGTKGITILSDSTLNVSNENESGTLSIDSSGITPLDQTMRLRNGLGDTCYFTIEVTYFRSSEA